VALDVSAQPGTSPLTLPALIRRHRNPLAYVVLWAPYIALYQISNRWPLSPPFELPFSPIDEALPFLPALLPIYVAYIPYFFWTVYRSRNDAEVNRLFYGTHLQLALSLPFFLFLPVAMPRHLYYGAESFGWADAFWRWFDAPNNCFPSLHVSNCLLFLQFNWTRPHRLAHTALGVAIVASTVLVKQHYVVDAFGGLIVYLAARWFLARIRLAGLES
jgi:hypothetical protein